MFSKEDLRNIKNVSGVYRLDRETVDSRGVFKYYKCFIIYRKEDDLKDMGPHFVSFDVTGSKTIDIIKKVFSDNTEAILHLKCGNSGIVDFCQLKLIASPDSPIEFKEVP